MRETIGQIVYDSVYLKSFHSNWGQIEEYVDELLENW